MAMTTSLTSFYARNNRKILILLACLFAPCPYIGLKLLGSTQFAFDPPPTSPAALATAAVHEAFPEQGTLTNLVIYVRSTEVGQALELHNASAFCNFTRALRGSAFVNASLASGDIFDFQSYCTDKGRLLDAITMQLVQQQGRDARGVMVPPGHKVNLTEATSAIVLVVVRASEASQQALKLAGSLKDAVTEAKAEAKLDVRGLEATVVGLPAFYPAILASAELDLVTIDAIVLPLAGIILTLLFGGQVQLVLITYVVAAVSFAFAFTLVYLMVLLRYAVIAVAPSLCCTVIIAMAIDYSTFALTRFREEMETSKSSSSSSSSVKDRVQHSVAIMLRQAGEIVLVSGSTLAACFLSLVLVPCQLVQSIGVTAAISLTVTMAVALVLIPCLLLAFPSFFASTAPSRLCRVRTSCSSSGCSLCCCCCCCCRRWSSCRYRTSRRPLGEFPRLIDSVATGPGGPGSNPNGGDDDDDSKSFSLTTQTLASRYSSTVGTVRGASTPFDRAPLPGLSWNDTRSCWARIGRAVTSRIGSPVTILIVLGAVAPVARYGFHVRVNHEVSLLFPRGAPSTAAFEHLTEDFPPGWSYPFTVLMTSTDAAAEPYVEQDGSFVLSPAELAIETRAPNNSFWRRCSEAIDRHLIPATERHAPGTLYLAPMYSPSAIPPLVDITNSSKTVDYGSTPPLWGVQTAKKLQGMPPSSLAPILSFLGLPLQEGKEIFATLGMAERQLINSRGDAVIAQLRLGVNPVGKQGYDTLKEWRDVVAPRVRSALNVSLTFSSFASDINDSADAVRGSFLRLVLIVAAVVLLIVGCAFRGVGPALRGVVTIAVTVLFVQGLAALVYDHGILNGLADLGAKTGSNFFEAFRSTGGLQFIVPTAVFPVMVGLALDYDIFLMTRVVEFKKEGLSDRDAVVAGVTKTGTIITVAGAIQGAAFFGLLFSSMPILQQLGFFLFVSVLFDTLVVRTLLVPALMALLGRLAWWPRSFAKERAKSQEAKSLSQKGKVMLGKQNAFWPRRFTRSGRRGEQAYNAGDEEEKLSTPILAV